MGKRSWYSRCMRNPHFYVSVKRPIVLLPLEIFFALLALCAGNSPATGEFPSQRPVTQSFDIFFDLCLNKRLSKQSWGWWFETPSHSLWRRRNAYIRFDSCFVKFRAVLSIADRLIWNYACFFSRDWRPSWLLSPLLRSECSQEMDSASQKTIQFDIKVIEISW